MSTFNIRQLEDRARDVDPDLRYMALEDFQKYLNNPKSQASRNVAFFVPLLFQLLDDSATEVQNQAVRSFAPLVRHSTDKEAAQIVEQLFGAVEKTANDSKFSTSVPTLALRSVFTECPARFTSTLSRYVLETLLPRIVPANPGSAPTMTIDKIEILIDMIKTLGSALTLPELSSLVASLVAGAFKEKGIIGTRSIIAVDTCLSYVRPASNDQWALQLRFYDQAVSDIVTQSKNTVRSSHSKDAYFTLFQVVLAKASATKALSESSIGVIFDEIVDGLKLESLDEAVDSEDLDIDDLIHTNLLRENALVTLAGLIPCFSSDLFVHSYASRVFEIVEKFMVYDPLLYEDSDSDAASGEDSEFDFSDDDEIEQFENTGENDGLAAKLRVSALVVVKKLLNCVPVVLSLFLMEAIPEQLVQDIGDRSELVSNEAIATLVVLLRLCAESKRVTRSRSHSDVSMATESVDFLPYSVVAREYVDLIEEKIYGDLLTPKNISRFSNTKVLIESLVSIYSDELSSEFLTKLSDSFTTFRLSLKTLPEIVKSYNVLLATYDFERLPVDLVDYIAEDLAASLLVPSTYHSVISEILSVCGALYKKVPPTAKYTSMMNNTFFPAISQNLRKREYSSDIRQYLLDSLAELVIHIDLTPENAQESLNIFQESLSYEVTANFTIETMVKVFEQKPEIFGSTQLCQTSLEKLTIFLSSSDSSLYVCSLTLLNVIFEKTGFVGPTENIITLRDVLFGLMKTSVDLNLIGKSFILLGHILERIPADETFIQTLITSVINTKFVDVDDINMRPLEYLTTQFSTHNIVGSERLFSIAMESLIVKNFISAKIMALICTTCQMRGKVDEIEQELYSYIQTPESRVDTGRVVFDIHFLGCMSTVGELRNFTFQEFFEIPKRESNESICLAAARAMGLCIVRNLNTHLVVLLNCYQKASLESDPHRTLYLVALKQLLKEASWADVIDALRSIWNSLIGVISAKEGQLSHKDVSELKLAGDILSSITEIDHDGGYQRKILTIIDNIDSKSTEEHVIYTVVVIMKQLVGRSTGDFEVQIIEKIMGYLAITNLELKSAIVSTLLTGIYNKSVAFAGILNSVILPAIYGELSAKEEFKKTIPMGPYKYVVDEGLEVRKLSYELISAILNLDSSKIQEVPFSVDEVKVFEVLSEKGLKDQENEIINLAVYNLMQIIQKNDTVLTKIGNQQELIASLSKISNKKLRTKASTQETESYEDTLRSAIKLSKVIDNAFVKNNLMSSEWSNFYHELKTKHHLLFSAVN
ncbi:hypothetical protein JCM33374_g5495 [Metschnikowia sp. JCM 33374]|nr:hypothetical protein JCM33374_g5495 [Metschnikowia sp. JCM 33374]